MHTPNLSVLVDGIVGLAIIAAAVILLCLGHIDGQTGIALIGAGAALASGSSKSALALKVPTHAPPPSPPSPPSEPAPTQA